MMRSGKGDTVADDYSRCAPSPTLKFIRLPPELQFHADVVRIVSPGVADGIADLEVDGFDGARQIWAEPIVGSDLSIGPRPHSSLAGRAGNRVVGLNIDSVRRRLSPLKPNGA